MISNVCFNFVSLKLIYIVFAEMAWLNHAGVSEYQLMNKLNYGPQFLYCCRFNFAWGSCSWENLDFVLFVMFCDLLMRIWKPVLKSNLSWQVNWQTVCLGIIVRRACFHWMHNSAVFAHCKIESGNMSMSNSISHFIRSLKTLFKKLYKKQNLSI